jgi:hypothetical protein
MIELASTAGTSAELIPEVIAQLLDVVADHTVDQALSGLEQVIARLRADEAEVADARETLRETPAPVLRDAMRLRAGRVEVAR